MGSRAGLVALALVAMVALAGCKDSCKEAGGKQVLSHYIPQVQFIRSGNVTIPITSQIPIYECVLEEQ